MNDPQSPRLAVLLAKLSKTVYRKSEEALPGVGIKDYLALTYLDDLGVPQQRLAERLGMDENNLVLLLNGLEAPGSIARRRDPDDRRRHIVEITPRGKKVLERAERGMDKLWQELLWALSPSEHATIKQFLRAIKERQNRLRKIRADIDVVVRQSRQDCEAVVRHARAIPTGVTLSSAP